MKNILIITMILVGALVLIGRAYLNSDAYQENRVFSQYSVLTSTWEKYKQNYIDETGRVIDPDQEFITTSEGQSYALLRAVWSDDKAKFDQIWQWTKNNLQREEDKLFSWKWGQLENGDYGVLPEGGLNSATDADSDIALALLFAAERWKDDQYRLEAEQILASIWEQLVVEVNGQYYLLPGTWANSETELVLNPSYFMPYSWRIFAEADPEHDWQLLIDPAYQVLMMAGDLNLNGEQGVGLPPNWLSLQKASGALTAPPADLTTHYSYDAMRVPWRITLDYVWFGDEQAHQYLATLEKLNEIYQSQGQFTSTYSYSGQPLTEYESPVMYATSLGYFQVIHPEVAENILNTKILSLYSNDENSFSSELNYYDENWLWFSLGLYYQALPNLYPMSGETQAAAT